MRGSTIDILEGMIIGLLVWPLEAFGVMILCGIIHNDVLPVVQPIGYGPAAFGIAAVLGIPTMSQRIALARRLRTL